MRPQVRAFGVSDVRVRELPLTVPAVAAKQLRPACRGARHGPTHDEAIRDARLVLALDDRRQPTCTDSRTIVLAIENLAWSGAQKRAASAALLVAGLTALVFIIRAA